MVYLIYKTTNLINNKIYIGKHQTKNIDDGYLGSGKYLIQDINLYGRDKFKREILYEFDNYDEMTDKEIEIVDAEFVLRLDTYNANLGGTGNWFAVNNNPILKSEILEKARQAASIKLKDPSFRAYVNNKISIGLAILYENGQPGAFKGKKHTEESKRKIAKANSVYQKGSGNSQYGTCWIYSEILKVSKKIPKEKLDESVKNGWIKGRKIKW